MDEIKREIRKMGFTQKEFAEVADIPYNYLNNTLNGYHVYGEVIQAFKKFGLRYEKSASKRKSAA